MIAIDPGAGGGIAWRNDFGVYAFKMPETIAEIDHLLARVKSMEETPIAILEKVGGYMPGNSGPASVKFARHCGHLDALLQTHGFRVIEVTPSKWMRAIGVPPKMDKTKRKAWIRDAMKKRWPEVEKITNATADALGMLAWAVDVEFKQTG